jgi:L-alanine-DL-glutamate epimerase-like enolase superfamily enzyme
MTTIDRIECYPVVVPLPEPLRVFGTIIREREFVFVRLYAGGYCGTGFGLSRGLPVHQIVRRQIEHHVLGRPLGNQRQIWDACRKSMRMTGEVGAYARALSLVDIALWDVWAQSLSVPLWRLLGGAQADIPCIAICGYYREDDPVGAVRAEAERLLKLGYTRFKIPFGADLRLDIQRLTAMREVIGPEAMLGIDASAAYDTVKEAQAAWQAVEQFNLSFFEDPFPATEIIKVVALTQSIDGRVAFGESVSDLNQLRVLAQNVDLYRPDATYQLGITGYLQTVPLAQAHGSWIMPHYYPDLHAPLVGALGGTMVEESPAEADTVNFGVLRGEQPGIKDGIWHLTERPGLGIVWDEEAIAHYRVSTQ